MFRIGPFTLTEGEVEKRKKYLELTPQDEERLRRAHPFLQERAGDIIDRFYEYLLSHEHSREMLSAPGLVDRLKKLQTEYFLELTSGNYDLGYFENRLKVGQAHHRIGLAPEWYLGAYVKYLHIASDVLSQAFARDYEGFYQTMVSLTKVIYLDMGLALDAYYFSSQAAQKRLTDLIVHDLQNPVAGIVGVLEVLLAKQGGLSEEERDAVREARRRCQDLSNMIFNVLQVSRAEAAPLQTYVENLDLGPLVRQVAEGFQALAAHGGQKLKVEAPDRLSARTDQSLLRRILENLIRNALRHTPPGTEVVLRAEAGEGGRPRLSVRDDGPGIPPDLQHYLFEPFGALVLREVGRHVDTGLGLASCRASAQALGAKLEVQSDGKRGTTFTLVLP